MLFNSHIFLFLFLPLVLGSYYVLYAKRQDFLLKSLLITASLIFYGYFNVEYTVILVGSILINSVLGKALIRSAASQASSKAKRILISGLVLNLGVLGYFKYTTFFGQILQDIAQFTISFPEILLPLGISFYTFQQVAFLVDCYRGEVEDYAFLDYALFVSFFPQLIAGPIVRFKKLEERYRSLTATPLSIDTIAKGVALFAIGLAKKELIADSLAPWVAAGFDQSLALSFLEAWGTSLAYTFQLYFDFSGYADMAIGLGMMMNIPLPQNFNAPYRSRSIQEFWQRWHITLGSFLRDYLYIPLGGSRQSTARTCVNLLTVFLLAGLWHGAGWLFIVWGGMHGAALVVHRLWKTTGKTLPHAASILLTFLFVHIAWIFFRAESLFDAMKILRGMVNIQSFTLHESFLAIGGEPIKFAVFLLTSAIIAFGFRTSQEQVDDMGFSLRNSLATAALLFLCFFTLNNTQTFLYFNF